MPEPSNADSAPQTPPPTTPADTTVSDSASIIGSAADKAFIRQCARKVKEGGTLTNQERNRLSAIQHNSVPVDVNFAANQTQLAQILGVSRKTIERHAPRADAPKPQADGRLNVALWRDFLSRTNPHINDADNDDSLNIRSIRARNLLLKNEELEADIAIKKKKWIPVTDVEAWGGELGAAIRQVVCKIHLCATSVVGMTVAEAELRLKEVEDDVLSQLNSLEQRIEEARSHAEPAS